jgi:DNA-binding Lrp family transcriptional regulator
VITTIVLVKAEPRLIPQCAKHLAAIEGVTDVYSVSGEWDLVVLVKVPQYDDIAKIVTEQFPVVPGLVRTTTLTAFKAYSKADLEQGWDIGAS